MTTEPVTVLITLPSGREIVAGTLDSDKLPNRYQPSANFTYAPAYLADSEAYPLSPDLDLVSGRQDAPMSRPSGLHAAFDDAAPDRWGQGLIRAENARAARSANQRPAPLSGRDYLLRVPDLTRQGALRFITSEGHFVGGARDSVPTFVDLERLVAAATAYERDEFNDEALAALMPAGSSLGGARPKSTVLTDAGRLALAKLPRESDRGDAMAWEATALHLATDAGLKTPPFRHTPISEDRSVLIVERFDRDGDRRVGYLSGASLMYANEGEVIDYMSLAGQVSSVSPQPREDSHELFRRAAFSALINNVDDHMRNHGVIRTRQGWELSPVFDVNPHPYSGIAASPLVIGGDQGDRDIRELVDGAAGFRLTRERAIDIVGEVERATSRWAVVARQYVSDHDAIPRYAAAFDTENRDRARALSAKLAPIRVDLAPDNPRAAKHRPDAVWVEPHLRNGHTVAGYWRRTKGS